MANFMDFAIVDWWISYSCITKYIYSWNRANRMRSFTKFSGNWVCNFIETLTMNFFLYWGRWWLEQEIIIFSVIWDQRTWLRDGWYALFVFPFTKQIDFKSWVQNTGIRGALANKIIFLKYSPCCQGSLKLECHEELEISSVAVAKSQPTSPTGQQSNQTSWLVYSHPPPT